MTSAYVGLGVDVSNYTGEIAPEQIACLVSNGIGYLIAGTQVPETTRQQLTAARDGGLTIGAYLYLYFDDPVFKARVQRGIEIALEFDCMLWLDVEDEEHTLSHIDVIAKLRVAQMACEDVGVSVGIYTSRSKWTKLTGNSDQFQALPLWDANYDVPKEFDAYFQPYGGWVRPMIHQFKGSNRDYCGVLTDINWAE